VSMGAPMCKKQAGEEPKVEVTDLKLLCG